MSFVLRDYFILSTTFIRNKSPRNTGTTERKCVLARRMRSRQQDSVCESDRAMRTDKIIHDKDNIHGVQQIVLEKRNDCNNEVNEHKECKVERDRKRKRLT